MRTTAHSAIPARARPLRMAANVPRAPPTRKYKGDDPSSFGWAVGPGDACACGPGLLRIGLVVDRRHRALEQVGVRHLLHLLVREGVRDAGVREDREQLGRGSVVGHRLE